MAIPIVALAIGGCVGEGPLHESKIETTLPTKVEAIAVGRTERDAVRQALGAPWLASDYWGFDLFRISDSNVHMVVILVPVWLSTDGTKGYVLTSYDASGLVTGYGKDVASKGSLWTGAADQGAAIQVGGVRFAVSGDGDEAFVAVDADRRDQHLKGNPPTDACRLLVGCAGDWCGTIIEIDGGTAVAMPGAVTRWLPAVAPIQVKAGDHRIRIKPTRWDMSFEAESQLSCAAGDTLYVVIDFEGSEAKVLTGPRRKLPAMITISREMPEVLRAQGMLVYSNGQWLAPQEAGS